MNIMVKILSMFVLLELILAPVTNNGVLINRSFAQNNPCEGKPAGWVVDSGTNRCVLSQDVINQENSMSECASLTGSARTDCFMRVSGSNFECSSITDEKEKRRCERGEKQSERYTASGILGGGANGFSASVSVFLAVQSAMSLLKKTGKCKAPSFLLMQGAAAGLIAGEIGAVLTFNKNIKLAKEEFDKVNLNNTEDISKKNDENRLKATDIQKAAFEAMIKKEEAIQKAAKTKKTFYRVASIAYYSSVAAAIVEQVLVSNPATSPANAHLNCFGTIAPVDQKVTPPATPPANPGILPDQVTPATPIGGGGFTFYKDQFKSSHPTFISKNDFKFLEFLLGILQYDIFVTSAYADSNDQSSEEEFDTKFGEGKIATYVSAALAGTGGALLATQAKAMEKLYGQPWQRIIGGGLLATHATVGANHAKRVEEYTENRIKILQDLKAKFEGFQSSTICQSRTDPSNPTCYCYNEDNTRNDGRGNSEVCSKEWGKAPSLYGKQNRKTYGKANSQVGCVAKNNQYDPNCRCKSQKSSNGGNNCMKMTGMNFKTSPFATQLAQSAAQGMNAAYSGDFDNAAINGMFNQSGAIRKKLAQNISALKNPKTVKAIKENENKMLTAASNTAPISATLGAGGDSSPINSSMSPQEAIKKVKEEFKNQNEVISNPSISNTNSGGASDEFNLGLNADPAGGVEEVMAQNFDYGSNDISKDGSANIFDILSLRYKRSGLRRLFEGEKDSTPDAPNADEINP